MISTVVMKNAVGTRRTNLRPKQAGGREDEVAKAGAKGPGEKVRKDNGLYVLALSLLPKDQALKGHDEVNQYLLF